MADHSGIVKFRRVQSISEQSPVPRKTSSKTCCKGKLSNIYSRSMPHSDGISIIFFCINTCLIAKIIPTMLIIRRAISSMILFIGLKAKNKKTTPEIRKITRCVMHSGQGSSWYRCWTATLNTTNKIAATPETSFICRVKFFIDNNAL